MLKLKLKPDKPHATASVESSPAPKIKIKKPRKSEAKSKVDKSEAPRLSLSLKPTKKEVEGAPRIRIKAARRPGDGYDSEAPDREDDPVIEEAIVLRMLPGEHLDYLRAACEQGDLSKVSVKFKDARRAVVSIHDQLFAAQLVDLPTVIEAQKSFDRKNIYKSADVCQMLLVTEPIEVEDDMTNIEPLPQLHPGGLTPPTWNVRKRRFRKRISNKIIESVEAKVDELFRQDEEANETHYELLNPKQLLPGGALLPTASTPQGNALLGEATVNASFDTSDQFDILGNEMEEVIYGDELGTDQNEDEDLLGMELEKALAEDGGEDASGAEEANKTRAGDDDDDDDDDDDEEEEEDDDDEDHEDLDEDQMEAIHHSQLLREEIGELESTISAKQRDADNTVNQIMRGRLLDVVNRLKQELDMKRRQLKQEQDTNADDAEDEGDDVDDEAAGDDNDNDDDDGDDDDDVDGLF